MPGLTQRDKDIMLWMITQRPSLAQAIESNKSMNLYLLSSEGLNPSNIMNCCFRMLSILISKKVGSLFSMINNF